VEALLSFKALKDSSHPEAVAIWSRYGDSGDETALNQEIMRLLSSVASSAKQSSAALPPGGMDSFPDSGQSS
jgi:hypothetical protein